MITLDRKENYLSFVERINKAESKDDLILLNGRIDRFYSLDLISDRDLMLLDTLIMERLALFDDR